MSASLAIPAAMLIHAVPITRHVVHFIKCSSNSVTEGYRQKEMSPKLTAFLKRNSSPIFNATVGEGNEEEFSMESEVHQRLIASQSKSITYPRLEQQPVCKAPIYGNCVKPVYSLSRPCTVYTRMMFDRGRGTKRSVLYLSVWISI
uniref:Uncharacterized protein n=1 Tax=Salix viminalis TaxID=40686 RepID=A0A6N2N248_SALVM